jgi:hypothetical protein
MARHPTTGYEPEHDPTPVGVLSGPFFGHAPGCCCDLCILAVVATHARSTDDPTPVGGSRRAP